MERLQFGKFDTVVKPTTISDPVRIYSMLMCMLFQQFHNDAAENKKIPIFKIFMLPIHNNINTNNLNILTWNSSRGIYTPYAYNSPDDVLYDEIKKMIQE